MKVNLKEQAPKGSFEYVKDLVAQALRDSNLFKKDEYAWIQYTYLDSVIVSVGPKYYLIPFSILDGKITFGQKKEVEIDFEVKENEMDWISKKQEKVEDVKESFEIIKEAEDMDIVLGEFVSLQEGTYDEESGEVEAILIEAGTNPHKKRHYPKETIQESASHFAGLKMYINHQTEKEERERPERDLRDWASTVIESRYEDGKAIGKIAIHDKWLRERMKDPVARKHIGLSINAGGKVSYGKIDGQEMQIVEKIVMSRQNGPASVDWVTEAGARGRVSRLLKESAYETEEKEMKTLKEATFEDLQKENPDLLKKIQESATKPADETKLKEANERIASLEKQIKLSGQKEKIASQLKECKLPEVAKTRIATSLQETVFEDDAKLKEAIEKAIKSELEYVNSISGKGKIKLGEATTSVKESLQETLDARMGYTKEKEQE